MNAHLTRAASLLEASAAASQKGRTKAAAALREMADEAVMAGLAMEEPAFIFPAMRDLEEALLALGCRDALRMADELTFRADDPAAREMVADVMRRAAHRKAAQRTVAGFYRLTSGTGRAA
jgi:hypothetical protein